MVKTVETNKLPEPIGPFSEGKDLGKLVFFAGQGGFDPVSGKVVPGGVQAEAEQACKNVGILLEAAGLTFANVIECTCFLTDMKDFQAFNEVYAKYFTSKPARTCVAVKELPAGIKCEIKAIAWRD